MMWTKEEYINWTKTRSEDTADWLYDDCWEADRHIEQRAIHTFINHPDITVLPEYMRDFITIMVRATMGSIETDELLTEMKCYPDYMV